MHTAVPAFTVQHYILHTLLTNFNYWSVSTTVETMTKTTEFRPRAVSRPRPQSQVYKY